MRLDLQLRAEVWFEQLTNGHGREGPAPAISPLPSIDRTDARYGQEKNATRSERGVKPPDSLLEVENQLECLSQNDAVKRTIGKHIGLCQITHQAGVRMVHIEVKHILLGDLGSTVALTIGVVPDLQHTSPNIRSPVGKKTLNVVPIDRCPPVPSEVEADRCRSSQLAKIDGPNWWRPRAA